MKFLCGVEQRLYGRTEVSPTGCWLWLGARRGNGYGAMRVDGKVVDTHRASYQITNGPIPPGMMVCHRCDVRNCINPEHLFLGTALDNVRDMVAKGRGRLFSGSEGVGERQARGERVPTHKLTDASVKAAREASSSGVTAAQIARSLGVHKSTVVRALHRKSWAHV